MGLLDRPPQSQRYSLLSPDVMSLIQSGGPRIAPAPAPAPARRERVSPWRVLDGIFSSEGDGTVSGSLDRERARLQAEADRPRLEAIAAENEGIARSLGPQALLAFRLNGEQLGGQLAEGFGTDVVAQGSGLFQGGRRVGEQPTYDTSGDQTLRRDSMGVSPVYTRTEPSIAERTAMSVAETGRINATNPVNVAPGGQLRDPRTGALIAQGAPRILAAADGTDLVQEGQSDPMYQNQRDVPAGGGRNGVGNFDATTRGALSEASQAAKLARTRAADARRFIALNQQNPTGMGAAVLGPAAALNPAYAEMRAISARLVPGERTPGAGPMSDGDAILYGRAVLDIDKPGPTNQALADVVIASAERDADYASFLDEYANLNGNLIGANEDWQAYVNANPLFAAGANGQTTRRPARSIQSWRDFMGFGERQRGGSQSRAGGNQPAPAAPPQVAYDAQGRRYVVRNGQWVAE